MTEQASILPRSAETGAHDVSTTEGGRAYLAEYFEKHLERRDFARYIAGELAGDFACVLAKHLQGEQAESHSITDSTLREQLADIGRLAQAVKNAGQVAHLYNSGSGMLMWIEAEYKSLSCDSAPTHYRLLEDGEVIERDDQFIEDDAVTWSPVSARAPIFAGMLYARQRMKAVRRIVSTSAEPASGDAGQ